MGERSVPLPVQRSTDRRQATGAVFTKRLVAVPGCATSAITVNHASYSVSQLRRELFFLYSH
jgi:hypothetical protein